MNTGGGRGWGTLFNSTDLKMLYLGGNSPKQELKGNVSISDSSSM